MKKIFEILKALSDETRFKIITLLLNRDFCVRALSRHLEISEAAVSQHLKILREAGLVKGEKRGYWVHYIVDRTILEYTGEELKKMAYEDFSCNIKENLIRSGKEKSCCRKEGSKNV
ncbi:MAG: metalloregulator ArsR/SmtB family transcription factor [Candidatus Eremiobacterota bacterium]